MNVTDIFKEAFKEDVWTWHDFYGHFAFLRDNCDKDYQNLTVGQLYKFLQDYYLSYLNFSAVLSVANQNEETKYAMKKFADYYNRVISYTRAIDGDKTLVELYLFEIT
jgi:hypothetical protein